jgi:hypothetical protein
VIRKDRSLNGGGVLLAVKHYLAPYIDVTYNDEDLLGVTLKTANCPILLVYYRKPNSPSCHTLINTLQTMEKKTTP